MERHALELLELPAILERLAGLAESAAGAARALALAPTDDLDEVVSRQALTSEAIAVLEQSAEPELADVSDVTDAAATAARGSVLEPATLSATARSIETGLAARAGLEALAEVPWLAAIAGAIDPSLGPLAKELGAAVEPDGSDLRDGASPALRRLRRELRGGRARLAERLRAFARDPAVREHLQDDFVTERAGRPVLALRATARAAVPGIVHDSSGSGQTLFVEPFAVVDESNRLREAESAEREEVERILRGSRGGSGSTRRRSRRSSSASRGSTSRSRAGGSPAAGGAPRSRSRRRSSCAAPAIRCSTRRPRSPSSSSSARSARS